jgi:hypothetical protein
VKKGESPPVYKVEELPVERRLHPRGRRQGGSAVVATNGVKKEVVARLGTPGRRTSDRKKDSADN